MEMQYSGSYQYVCNEQAEPVLSADNGFYHVDCSVSSMEMQQVQLENMSHSEVAKYEYVTQDGVPINPEDLLNNDEVDCVSPEDLEAAGFTVDDFNNLTAEQLDHVLALKRQREGKILQESYQEIEITSPQPLDCSTFLGDDVLQTVHDQHAKLPSCSMPMPMQHQMVQEQYISAMQPIQSHSNPLTNPLISHSLHPQTNPIPLQSHSLPPHSMCSLSIPISSMMEPQTVQQESIYTPQDQGMHYLHQDEHIIYEGLAYSHNENGHFMEVHDESQNDIPLASDTVIYPVESAPCSQPTTAVATALHAQSSLFTIAQPSVPIPQQSVVVNEPELIAEIPHYQNAQPQPTIEQSAVAPLEQHATCSSSLRKRSDSASNAIGAPPPKLQRTTESVIYTNVGEPVKLTFEKLEYGHLRLHDSTGKEYLFSRRDLTNLGMDVDNLSVENYQKLYHTASKNSNLESHKKPLPPRSDRPLTAPSSSKIVVAKAYKHGDVITVTDGDKQYRATIRYHRSGTNGLLFKVQYDSGRFDWVGENSIRHRELTEDVVPESNPTTTKIVAKTHRSSSTSPVGTSKESTTSGTPSPEVVVVSDSRPADGRGAPLALRFDNPRSVPPNIPKLHKPSAPAKTPCQFTCVPCGKTVTQRTYSFLVLRIPACLDCSHRSVAVTDLGTLPTALSQMSTCNCQTSQPSSQQAE